MDHRLAAIKDEIDKIMSAGPVGRWSSPPPAFPFMNETVIFNADGSGLISSWSALAGKSLQVFGWSMEARGRLVMRYGLPQFAGYRADPPEEPESPTELSPVTLSIEIEVQETELGPWPVMTSEGRDTFDCLQTALAREEPPLTLQRPSAGMRALLSRARDLVWRGGRRQHAAAALPAGSKE